MTERALAYHRQYRSANLNKAKIAETSYRRRRQEEYNELKSKPCVDCKRVYSPWVMQFDHRDPSTKTQGVGKMVLLKRERIMAEIAKCDLVCANCHMERTHKQLQNKVLMNGRRLLANIKS